MYSTKQLAKSTKGLSIERDKIFRPSFFYRLIAIAVLVFSIFFWLILFNSIVKQVLLPVTIGGLLFVSFIIWINIWHSFLNRKYNFTIKFCKEHIEIDRKIIPWAGMVETQIMVRGSRRGKDAYLVIFTADQQVHKYALFKIGISNWKLSTLIELYKSSANVHH